jgi:hypothetical protein
MVYPFPLSLILRGFSHQRLEMRQKIEIHVTLKPSETGFSWWYNYIHTILLSLRTVAIEEPMNSKTNRLSLSRSDVPTLALRYLPKR